jgi:isopenicillin-N epimerase
MVTRRSFLGSISYPLAAAAAGLAMPRLSPADSRAILDQLAASSLGPDQAAGDEDFWGQVARAFTIDRSVINLNNGGVSPSPEVVQEAMKRHLDFSNSMPPPVALWKILEPQKEGVRERLARHWGVDPEEIAITRNSSESLQICQLGMDLHPGDEILACTQDYPRMLTTFRQRCRREGLTLNLLRLPIPCEDDDLIVRTYEQAITPRTRLLLLSHIINITGQILPVRRIVEMARARGVPVIVDGAHALAHFAFKLPDLACDYYGVSLHKWLAAPHGTGLLYVRRDKIRGLWPMQAADEKLDGDIRKFEEIGTHPAANILAIGEALTFHQALGDVRKQARLAHLRQTWVQRLTGCRAPHSAIMHTPAGPGRACGIATVQLEGIDSGALADHLWTRHHILVTAIKHPEFEGIRVTPSVYTTMEEIDRFCDAAMAVMRDGLPA